MPFASGFASPALGYEDGPLDFNRLLIKNPPATFIMRMDGGDMADRGVPRGSILVVDRSVTPTTGTLAVLAWEGALVCREMTVTEDGRPAFTDGKTRIVPAEGEAEVFGTVKAIVRLL